MSAPVRDGCYRFDDGTPLFKIIGNQGVVLSKTAQVKTFRIDGWNELSHKTVVVRPAFLLPGLLAGNPHRGDTAPIPTIPYSTFAFDPERGSFMVPIIASGAEKVTLGRPC